MASTAQAVAIKPLTKPIVRLQASVASFEEDGKLLGLAREIAMDIQSIDVITLGRYFDSTVTPGLCLVFQVNFFHHSCYPSINRRPIAPLRLLGSFEKLPCH